MTDLSDKAIDFKGQKYVLVKDRVMAFNEEYKNGSIRTEWEWNSELVGKVWVVKATVIPDVAKPERYFTGYSQAVEGSSYINKTSALENAETSAIGRALAMMGIGVIDSIASADEISKAEATKTVSPRVVGKVPSTGAKVSGTVTTANKDTNGNGEPLPWEGEDTRDYLENKGVLTDEEKAMKEVVDETERPETRACKTCGEIATYRTGVSKTGKEWAAYFCSTDNREHAEFVNS